MPPKAKKAAEPECTCLEDFPPAADALAFGCEHARYVKAEDGSWAADAPDEPEKE